ncbi:Uma2 family endonuclease [Pseudonocardia sp. CA-107938]|uniref:Uma2 family endonuclease n=1 Tax=Pseudonocardia sp. CA-107938 TaxID=3240021 RepID=UPI003D8AEBE1
MGSPVLDHDGPFTEDDYLRLAPPSGHVELVEGTLLVGPQPGPELGAAVAAVRAALEKALPEGLRVIGAVPLRLGHDCVLVPALAVARIVPEAGRAPEAEGEPEADAAEEPAGGEETEAADEPGQDLVDGADVLIVVDVVDRTHGITQRSFKPQLYARSRIPYALLVDSAARVASASMLIGGRHHEFARAGVGGRLVLEDPYRVEIDLDALGAEEPAADQ